MSLSKDELLKELRDYQKEFDSIVEFYRRGDQSRGDVRFDSWIGRFRNLLRTNLPEHADMLNNRSVAPISIINGNYPNVYELFMDIRDGEYLRNLIEMLIFQIDNGIIKIQKKSKIITLIKSKNLYLILILIIFILVPVLLLELGYLSTLITLIIILFSILIIFFYFIRKILRNHPKRIG